MKKTTVLLGLIIVNLLLALTGGKAVYAQTPTTAPVSNNNDDSFWRDPAWVLDTTIGERYYCQTFVAYHQLSPNYYYIKWPVGYEAINVSGPDQELVTTATNFYVKNLGPTRTRYLNASGGLTTINAGESAYVLGIGRFYVIGISGEGSWSAKVCIQKATAPVLEYGDNTQESYWGAYTWTPAVQEGKNLYCADFSTYLGAAYSYYIKWPSGFTAKSTDGLDAKEWDFGYTDLYIKNNGPSVLRYEVSNGYGFLWSGESLLTSGSSKLVLISNVLDASENGAFSVTVCVGRNTSLSNGNLLSDGDMEQLPLSYDWMSYYSVGRDGFGRIDTSNIFNHALYGDARCGKGIQVIGSVKTSGADPIKTFAKQGNFSDIVQYVDWPGGTPYFRFSLKSSGLPAKVSFVMTQWIKDGFGTTTYLWTGWVGAEWTDYSGSGNYLPQGTYGVSFILGQGSDAYFSVDDVVLDTAPITGIACSPTVIPTITPTGPTPTVDYRDWSTSTPAPTWSTTPTLYPTNSYGGTNRIMNCGFGYGESPWAFSGYWDYDYWHHSAYVIYTSDNYGFVESDAIKPGIKQNFYWPGGIAYVSWWSPTNSGWDVSFTNNGTGQNYPLSSGMPPGDYKSHKGTIYMPTGNYDINLNSYGYYGSTYDNISVAQGSYGTCVQANTGSATGTPMPNATPSPRPSATPTGVTPTMYPTSTQKATSTQQPTATVLAGTATSTARPSMTPWPTYTPYPSFTPYSSPVPTFTPAPWKSPTAYPTYTSQPTYTPLPTYTPNGSGTIEPSPTTSMTPTAPPQQPPPDYYTLCERPQSAADLAAWTEYEKCQMLSFFAMSPNAVSTVSAIPTMFNGSEPFGTFNEVKDTNQKMKQLIDSYDWNNTGLPGVKDAPDPGQFMAPAADSPLVTGKFDFTKGSSPISQTCTTAYTRVIGPQLSPGFCMIINFMREKNILAWIQLLVNLAALGFLAIYIWRNWI